MQKLKEEMKKHDLHKEGELKKKVKTSLLSF
jgi:hypothetical protein